MPQEQEKERREKSLGARELASDPSRSIGVAFHNVSGGVSFPSPLFWRRAAVAAPEAGEKIQRKPQNRIKESFALALARAPRARIFVRLGFHLLLVCAWAWLNLSCEASINFMQVFSYRDVCDNWCIKVVLWVDIVLKYKIFYNKFFSYCKVRTHIVS